ncbi:BldC family transcriptional regulator [Kineococcus gypseus]|uniref:MerR family transcriptional regulator n=1 Tax=Kineococcus gypseus TaxID=1637102 RepID=UPI003D7E00A7
MARNPAPTAAPPQLDRPLSTGEVADLLGVNRETIRRAAAAGRIPCITLPGGHRRFTRATVDKLLTEQTQDVA